MSTLTSAASWLGVLGSALWLAHLAHLARHRGKVVFLAGLPDDPPPAGWPTLTVAFAAQDEAAMVDRATRSMLAQDYPGLEVIAVDDRSVDGTGATLDAIAREDGRLRVIHVRDLPPGWLGKTHALQTAADSTRSRWILFTDADVLFGTGALSKAIAFAEANRVDHVTVGPELPTESAGERAFLVLFGLIFSMHAPIGHLDDPGRQAHAGVGAFNLVRSEAFRAIGGFRHLALTVDDDMRLARALKFAGYRMRLLMGLGSVSVRWQVGLAGMIRGLEKNLYAAMGFRPERALGGAAVIVVVAIMPFVGLFVGPWWARAACGLGVLAITAMVAAMSRQTRIGWYYAALIPAAGVAFLVALARSVVLARSRGGVLWRGHLYPIEELKAHARIRDAWLGEVWRSTR